eukprot:14366920-Ditylum_brightwellii.AAC.1
MNVKNNFKIWKEQTSTSPDGRYITLYKTWLKVPEEKTEECEGLTSDEFFNVITTVIKLCQQHNISLPRWVTVHNLYIQKQAGNFKLHRLQTIHKLESEVNLLRREVIACQLMNNVEKINYLDDDQHDGRNGRSAIDIVLGK